jgi:CBS domain-containing protein
METVTAILEDKGYDVISAELHTTGMALVKTMVEKHVGAVLITDNGRPVGIVAERDLMTRVLLKQLDPEVVPAREIMSEDLVVITPDTPIREAQAIMTEKRCRHLPVVRERKVVGLVSIGDCNRWVSRDQEFTIRHMAAYIQGDYPG